VLRGERRIELRRHTAQPRRRAKSKAEAAVAGPDEALFEALRRWRSEIAREHGVPAYVVLHDGTLRAIAQLRPQSLDALRGISGIGEKKLERYGADVLRLVAEPAA
jgi:ATP-dependent DNA helicase RecQ